MHGLHDAIDFGLSDPSGIAVVLLQKDYLEVIVIGVKINNDSIPAALRRALLESPVVVIP